MRKLCSTLPILLLASGVSFATAHSQTPSGSSIGTQPQVPVPAGLQVAVSTTPTAQAPAQPQVQSKNGARRGSWRDVENLPPGTRISVQPLHGRRFRCVFESASGEELICEPMQRAAPCLACVLAPVNYGPIHTDSRYVRDVHIEHPDANMAIGAAVGAASGFAWGAQDTDASRPASMAVGGVLLGALGGLIGRHVPIVRGTAVYER